MLPASENKFYFKSLLSDPSAWALLISNLLVIFFALYSNWNIMLLVWIYWAQNLIIGFFYFIRILNLEDFSPGWLELVSSKQIQKLAAAFFFLIHYGMFHIAYLMAIVFATFTYLQKTNFWESTVPIDFGGVLLIPVSLLIFFLNHLFSLAYNRKKERAKYDLAKVIFYPYLRILPMTFVVVLAFTIGQELLLQFLLLKTFVDVAMHIAEHKLFQTTPSGAVS